MKKWKLFVSGVTETFEAEDVKEAWDKALDFCYNHSYNVINLEMEEVLPKIETKRKPIYDRNRIFQNAS